MKNRIKSELWRLNTLHKLLFSIIFLSFLFSWINILLHLRNPVPYCDDFQAILNFYNQWESSHSLTLLFQPYNEAVVFISKLVLLIYRYLFGLPIDFELLTNFIWIGPITLAIVLSLIFLKGLKQEKSWLVYLALLIPCLIFQPIPFGTYLWLQSGLTHGYILSVALLALWTAVQRKLLRSIFCMILAILVSGVGIILLPVWVAVFLPWKNIRPSKLLLRIIILIVTFVLTLGVFGEVISGNSNSIYSFLKDQADIIKLLQFPFVFLGGYFSFGNAPQAFTCGMLLVLTALFVNFRAETNEQKTLKFFTIFLMFVPLAACILRGGSTGTIADALTSRYNYYSVAFFLTTYIALILRLKNNYIRGGVFFCLLFLTSFWLFRTNPKVIDTAKNFHFQQVRSVIFSRFFSEIEIPHAHRPTVDLIMKEAEEKNIYKASLAPKTLAPYLERDVVIPATTAQITYEILQQAEDANFFVIAGWAMISTEKNLAPKKICLLAKDQASNQNFRICFPRWIHPDEAIIKEKFQLESARNVGFQLILPKYLLGSKKYKLGLMLKGNKDWHYQWMQTDYDPMSK